MERCILILRYFLHLPEQLGCGRLIDTACIRETADPYRFQYAQDTGGVNVRRKFRHVKTDLYMGLGRQIVDLVRLYLGNHLYKRHGIRQIAVVQMEVRKS